MEKLGAGEGGRLGIASPRLGQFAGAILARYIRILKQSAFRYSLLDRARERLLLHPIDVRSKGGHHQPPVEN